MPQSTNNLGFLKIAPHQEREITREGKWFNGTPADNQPFVLSHEKPWQDDPMDLAMFRKTLVEPFASNRMPEVPNKVRSGLAPAFFEDTRKKDGLRGAYCR